MPVANDPSAGFGYGLDASEPKYLIPPSSVPANAASSTGFCSYGLSTAAPSSAGMLVAVGAPLLPVSAPAAPVSVNVFWIAPPPVVLVVELGLVKSFVVSAGTAPSDVHAPIVPVVAGATGAVYGAR